MNNKCPYCRGVKRIRDDLVHYTRRSILEIKHGNQLWSKFILPNNDYDWEEIGDQSDEI